MPTYVFRAFFTKSKIGVAPAAAPVVDVCDSAGTLVVTGGAVTTLAGMVGMYGYSYTNAVAGEYIALFRTTDTTVDLAQLPSWTPTVIYTQLDAAVSTRLAAASYSAPPTAAANADAVWDEAIAGHVTPGTTGPLLSLAGAAADPLLNAVPGAYAAGTAGAALGRVGNNTVTVVSPVATDSAITLVYGDDYLLADGRQLSFTGTTWPTITGGTIALIVQAATVISLPGVVTGAGACYVSLTSVQVNSLGLGAFDYDLQVTLTNGHVVTLVQSTLTVVEDVR
jgi:hypothetical protein